MKHENREFFRAAIFFDEKAPRQKNGFLTRLLVAGARFELTTFGL